MKLIYNISTIILFGLALNAQTIEKSSIDSGGTSATAGGISIVYSIGEVAVQEVSVGGVSVSEGFIGPEPKLDISANVFLQGPLLNPTSPTLMNDNLRSLGLIPTTSPYEDGATCEASVFNITGSLAIVDWVWLSLRANDDSTRLVNGRSALLRRDGSIVDVDGVTPLRMRAYQNTYYLAIEHRNHLGVMNAIPTQFNANQTNDFNSTIASFDAFGSNARVNMGENTFALWAGDGNGDGKVQFSGSGNDVNILKDFILANAAVPLLTFPVNGYLNTDTDLDGAAKFSGAGNDSNLIKDIIFSHPVNLILGLPTFTITSQVPN